MKNKNTQEEPPAYSGTISGTMELFRELFSLHLFIKCLYKALHQLHRPFGSMVVGPFVDVQLHIPVVAEGARHHPWRTYIKRCDLEMQQTYFTLVLAPTAL